MAVARGSRDRTSTCPGAGWVAANSRVPSGLNASPRSQSGTPEPRSKRTSASVPPTRHTQTWSTSGVATPPAIRPPPASVTSTAIPAAPSATYVVDGPPRSDVANCASPGASLEAPVAVTTSVPPGSTPTSLPAPPHPRSLEIRSDGVEVETSYSKSVTGLAPVP